VRYILAVALCEVALLTARAGAGETTSVPATSRTRDVPAYVARPVGSAPAPGVLVLHGCEGYSRHYAKIADRLASHGYVAVAIDTLAPQGIHNACSNPSGSHTEADDARAALEWMHTQPYIDGSRLALVGYSMGAIATLDLVDAWHAAAAPTGLQAAVAYYPACRNRDPASVRVPIRILDGDADDWTPAAPCQALAEAARTAGKAVSITTYPGATHAFNVDAPDRVALGHHLRYDAAAASAAETQTLDFLRRYLGATP
jgi:dienelactone hydrolase